MHSLPFPLLLFCLFAYTAALGQYDVEPPARRVRHEFSIYGGMDYYPNKADMKKMGRVLVSIPNLPGLRLGLGYKFCPFKKTEGFFGLRLFYQRQFYYYRCVYNYGAFYNLPDSLFPQRSGFEEKFSAEYLTGAFLYEHRFLLSKKLHIKLLAGLQLGWTHGFGNISSDLGIGIGFSGYPGGHYASLSTGVNKGFSSLPLEASLGFAFPVNKCNSTVEIRFAYAHPLAAGNNWFGYYAFVDVDKQFLGRVDFQERRNYWSIQIGINL